MTIEALLDNITWGNVTMKQAREYVEGPACKKMINFFLHRDKITKDTMKDSELSQLKALVEVLQILYTSQIGSPLSDDNYDTLQEVLVDMGVPRLTGSIEINDSKKLGHNYPQLRGTLHKIYYLTEPKHRTNPSRKTLDEWIKAMEAKYKKNTGKDIDMNDLQVIITPKFDGASCVAEREQGKTVWLTRGDTKNNRASDVSHIMNIFNEYCNFGDLFDDAEGAVKFEVMCTEENKDKINSFYRNQQYRNSRQVVTATLNSNEPDYKADYMYPIPLRALKKGSDIESVHPGLIEKFPTLICKLSDRDKMKEFADENKWVKINGMRFRVDGMVITLTQPSICRGFGRDNEMNNFEVAYKFTEEHAYTKVRDIEFYVSEFGFITPVLVVNDVILKGNTINRISLSNKERFDELFLARGDDVKVLYDIIPYATRDEKCNRVKKGYKIPFVERCPRCKSELDLDAVQVQCRNMECPSRIIGRILNYCTNLRIQNIGANTLETLYSCGLLKKGILSLYKLKKKTFEIEELEGFGKLKTRKIIREIEAKRRLKDYEFFGSIGIEGLSQKTFQTIFNHIRYQSFMELIDSKRFDRMMEMLIEVPGIAEKKADALVTYLRDSSNRKEVTKLIEELSIYDSIGEARTIKGTVVFSGFRDSNLEEFLERAGYRTSGAVTKSTSFLIVKDDGDETTKVQKAKTLGVPIVPVHEVKLKIN